MPSLTFDVLVPYGWSDRVLALYVSCTDAVQDHGGGGPSEPLSPARVVRVTRSSCVAVFPDGAERRLRGEPLPAVGDWIAAEADWVRAVLPRWSALTRGDPSGVGEQTLAANVDIVAVTTPADRSSAARVERELAIAWDSGAVPLVVVTKADLGGGPVAAGLEARLSGVEVVTVSAATGAGVGELRARLAPHRTVVLIGPSGAGKSTLANAVLGADVLATAAVRAGDARGRHTTTSRQLLTIPGGGVLIDTPGLRSLGLPVDVDVGAGFPDVEALAAGCRFADCRHEEEPGCAVAAAVQTGELDPDRLQSFRKLAREAAADRVRHDPLARQAQRRVWKGYTKDARANEKRRRG